MITTPARDDIRAFAAAVRAHLDDLPADDVDDLLDGLEADLSDQAAEAGDDFEVPDAATYAAELRAAAGLPERIDATAPPRRSWTQHLRAGWDSAVTKIRANPAAAWLLDLLASLRPVWWVLRALTLYLLIVPLFSLPNPGSVSGVLSNAMTATRFPGIVILGTLLLVSIQWGRGRWASHRPLRIIRTIVNVFAVILAPFYLIGLLSGVQAVVWNASWSPTASYTPGLAVDGQRVRNVYAYDAAGNPIPSVQLFTQDGKPLTTVGADDVSLWDSYFAGGGGPVPVPYQIPGSAPAWNIFPLREIPADQQTWNMTDDVAAARATTFPFSRVQPLPDAITLDGGATPTPTSGGGGVTPSPVPGAGDVASTPLPAPSAPAGGSAPQASVAP